MLPLKDKNKGFSLTEIIVVVGIFSASIVAIFQLVWKNIYVQKHNRDFLVASMLSQEGLELVRNLRDKNWLDESEPGAFAGLYNPSDSDFAIDYTFTPDDAANDTGNDDIITDEPLARLYINSDGFYDHNAAGTSTKFFRIIKVKDTDPNDGMIEVTSLVEWDDYVLDKLGVRIPLTRKYAASTELYDWR